MQLYLSTKNGDESNAKARLYSPPDGYAAKRRFCLFLTKSRESYPHSPSHARLFTASHSVGLRMAICLLKRGIVRVEVLRVKIVLRHPKRITEALIMHDLAGTKKFDWLPDVGIIHKTENVVVRRARLLLCYYHVFAMFWTFQEPRKILIFQGVSRF